jgi:acyl-CoA synthetase (AMP-forming)/AMP-acid ligase II
MNDLPLDIGALTDYWRQEAPDREALRCGDRSWTWTQFAGRVDRNVAAQLAAGLQPGDRIAILDRNGPVHLETALACRRAGTVLVPVNFRLTPSEACYPVSDARATLLIVGDEFRRIADVIKADVPSVTKTVVVGGDDDQYERWLADAEPATGLALPPGDACCLQVYTSGTTGFPKGAMLTGDSLTAQAVALGSVLGMGPETICLGALPTFHIAGFAWAFTALHYGGRVILLRDVEPSALLDEITGQRVTHVLMVPALLGAVLQVPGVADRDYSHLEVLAYAAAPTPPSLLRRCLETLPVPFVHGYGMTEASMAISTLGDREHRDIDNPHRLASVGKPVPGTEIEIADPASGQRLGPGQVGEVLVRSRQLMLGYWDGTGPDTSAITPDGWLRTGDAGHLDDDGYLYLTGRLKDMYISSGDNVYAAEVERVITGHPDVAEAAVIGVPDDAAGEVGLAFLLPAPGARIDESDVLRYCREHLAEYKRPASVVVVDGFPRNALGKVVKEKLRELVGQAN